MQNFSLLEKFWRARTLRCKQHLLILLLCFSYLVPTVYYLLLTFTFYCLLSIDLIYFLPLLLIVYYLLTDFCLLFTGHILPFTLYSLLMTVYCLLFTVHGSLYTVSNSLQDILNHLANLIFIIQNSTTLSIKVGFLLTRPLDWLRK